MSHEIDETTGRAAMAYVGEVPWHGLGQSMPEGASLEEWSSAAGMDWEAVAAPVLYVAGDDFQVVDDRVVIHRSDTNAALGIVSDRFKIVQPATVLEFFRDLIEQSGFQMETAGCLFGGRKLWAMAKVGEGVDIGGGDVIKPYAIFGTAMDGTMASVGHLTSVRVVCNNTLRMAIGSGGKMAKVRIPHNVKFSADYVKQNLGIAQDAWTSFIGNAETLASARIAYNDAVDVVAKSLKDEWTDSNGDDMTVEGMIDSSRELKRIMELFDGGALGAALPSSKGTMWGLVNAVTQYMDHEVVTHSLDRSRAFDKAQFGNRAEMKVKIANRLLELA